MASFSKGDRVIATGNAEWINKGTKGVVVETAGVFSGPKVAFENGKTTTFPADKLAKI